MEDEDATIGRRRWAIAEGYIPGWSHGPEPEMESHETVCLLNAADRIARIEITVFFEGRDPAGPYRVTVPPRRTRHVRLRPTSPWSSNPMSQSSSSTRGSIPGRPRTR